MRVFIVEDELIVLEEIKIIMENLEYDVVGVSKSWSVAYEQICVLRPDVLLLDIMLNDIYDGVNLAEEICKIYNPYIFFVTAYADKQTISKAQGVRPHGYIVKPVTEKSIFAALELGISAVDDSPKIRNLFTVREVEVINCIAKGLTEELIAKKLYISSHTVKSHKKNIFRKSNVSSVVELTVFALKNQLI